MFFFDILLIITIIYSFYYGFKHGISKPLYEITIIFIGFSLAGNYGYDLGVVLTKYKILMPDSIALMKLIGFLLLFLLYWGVVYLFEKYKSKFIKKGFKKLNKTIGGTVNALQFFIITTLAIFFINQLTVGKLFVRKHLLASYSYPKIEKTYKNIFTGRFVDDIIQGNMTGTNANELLIQTITDEKVINSVK